MELCERVDKLKGIGPKTAALFEKLNIYTIEDLLYLFPRNYLSYESPKEIENAEIGRRVAVKAVIQSYVEIKKVRSLTLVTCMVKDGTKSLKLTWYNSPFLKQIFHIGQTFIFVGTVMVRNYQLVMEHPEYYTIKQYENLQSSLQPVYPLTEGLSNKTVMKAVSSALTLAEQIKEKLPEELLENFKLLSLKEAMKGTHFPKNTEELMKCRNRLVFDEFFYFLVRMHMVREKTVKAENHFRIKDWNASETFIKGLPFSLTEGQKTAISEIKSDMAGSTVMNRLIQGDVGSGKTVVASLLYLLQ